MIITYTQLAALNACPEQLALFKQRYGEGGRVTKAKVLAGALDFDWDWAARSLLDEAQLTAYLAAARSAKAAHLAATGPAKATYYAATGQAAEAYAGATRQAGAAYAAAIGPAGAAYAAASRQAETAYLAASRQAETAYAAVTRQAKAAYAGERALAFWQASLPTAPREKNHARPD